MLLALWGATGPGASTTVTGTPIGLLLSLTRETGGILLDGTPIGLLLALTRLAPAVPPEPEPEPEPIPPPPGGAGGVAGRPRYKRASLKKRRKRDECEELLEYLRSLPPAEAQAAVAALPASSLSLLDGLPLPHAIVLPPSIDDDEDECALLLEILLS